MKSPLEKLSLANVNPGACTGANGWISDQVGSRLVSYNPTRGQPLATAIPGNVRHLRARRAAGGHEAACAYEAKKV